MLKILKLKLFILISITIICSLLSGCYDQADLISGNNANDFDSNVTSSSSVITIGEKLENPYTVEVMRKAYEQIKNRGDINININEIKSTHYYIRFEPSTEEQLEKLYWNKDLDLFPYPLDHKISGTGSVVKNALGSSNDIQWLYTAVKKDLELPQDIPFTILAELYLPPDESEVRYNSSYEILEIEALKLTGNYNSDDATRGKWYPEANLKWTDNSKNQVRPIVDANVRFRNWFKWYDGWTNSEGKLRSPKGYYGDISYSVKWEYHDEKWDIRDGRIGQAFINGPSQSKSTWNRTFTDGRENFHATLYTFLRNNYKSFSSHISKKSFVAYDRDPEANDIGLSSNQTKIYRFSDFDNNREFTTKELFEDCNLAFAQLQLRAHDDFNAYDHTFASALANAKNKYLNYYGYSVNYFDFYREKTISSEHCRTSPHNIEVLWSIQVMDNYNEGANLGRGYVWDAVSGYTYQQIFESCSNASNFSTLKTKLKNVSNSSSGHIETLFLSCSVQ